MNFAKILKDYREQKEMTQRSLAQELQVSVRTITYWENGKKLPTGCTVFRLPRKWQKFVSKEKG